MPKKVVRLCRGCAGGNCTAHKGHYVAGSGCLRKCECGEHQKKA